MQKLFTCLYGSRLYGTQTPTSDLDVKHIYLPDLNEMLVGKPLVNKVKKTNNEKNTRNDVDDVDEEFVPVQVFARDFMLGQTYALELAFAVDGDHARQRLGTAGFGILDDEDYRWYQVTGDRKHLPFYKFVSELREKFLTSNIKALMGYAVNQASLYSFKGERLDVSRKFLKAFEDRIDDDRTRDTYLKLSLGRLFNEHLGFNMSVHDLLADFPKYFKLTEYDIGGGVMKPCFTLLEKTFPFTNTVEQSVKVAKALISKYGTRADAASVDHVDWKATMHALRVVDEGLQLLEFGFVEFPFQAEYVNRLLSVKRGEVPLDEVKEELNQKLDRLKSLEENTFLPTLTQEMKEEFEQWLAQWMRRFYNVK